MKPENREEGFMAVKQAISQAGKQGERLLVLPELVLGGVPDDLQQAQCVAIREDDPVWKELSSLVMENHVDVILGFVLEENGKLWNAAVCEPFRNDRCTDLRADPDRSGGVSHHLEVQQCAAWHSGVGDVPGVLQGEGDKGHFHTRQDRLQG